jgi:F-type H+-transporting ATPase subunit epsilon
MASTKELDFILTTPTGVIYEESVSQVTITTSSGEITVLPEHTPLVSTLGTGSVVVKKNDIETLFAIDGGVLEMRPDNTLVVLSDHSEQANDIEIERAEEALVRAQELMSKKEEGVDLDINNLQQVMARELNRVKIAKKNGRR